MYMDISVVTQAIERLTGKADTRRSHPLFGHLALMVLQEVANRRLFSVVREERRLTYDASFNLRGSDAINGGWYLVSVTSSPPQVQAAVAACKDALASLRGQFGVQADSVESCKRTLINRAKNDRATNDYWVNSLSGTQLDSIPNKSIQNIVDFEKYVDYQHSVYKIVAHATYQTWPLVYFALDIYVHVHAHAHAHAHIHIHIRIHFYMHIHFDANARGLLSRICPLLLSLSFPSSRCRVLAGITVQDIMLLIQALDFVVSNLRCNSQQLRVAIRC
jgi:Peptidase M16 inactive domain